MRKTTCIFIMCLTMASFSCKRLLNPVTTDNIVVASIGERELLGRDIKDVFTKDMSAKDSLIFLESYVNMWVKKELKLEMAETMFSDSHDDIEKMVKEYRNSLLNYKLDQYHIEQSTDTSITRSNINNYYTQHSDKFILDKTIVKGVIVKVPESYRQSVKLRKLMESKNSEKQRDFFYLCEKNNFQLTTFDEWVDFSDFLSFLPTRTGDNHTKLLKNSGVQVMAGSKSRYLFNIYEHINKGSITPIERVENSIRKFILNQRKVDVIRIYEDSLYINAKLENKININIRRDQQDV